MKMMDSYECSDRGTLRGAWWLIEGADRDGFCMVSWALTEGPNQKKLGFTQYQITDFNKVGTNLKGQIIEDDWMCQKNRRSNLTFLIKDPSENLYRIHYDPDVLISRMPFEFEIKAGTPTDKKRQTLSDMNGNLCRGPYCTKLISEETLAIDD